MVLALTLPAQTDTFVYEIVGSTMSLRRDAETMRRLAFLPRLVAQLHTDEPPAASPPERLREGIPERGTHEELVARGGMAAELFALQAAAYG